MTSRGTKKRRYLDDTNVIHIINQPAQYNSGEIKQSPSKIRQLTDNIAGSVKQQLSGNAPVSPYLAYPAAGMVATAMFNPITTLASIVKGGIGGGAVNKVSKILTDKTWGENVERVLDINPDVAEFTNPGYSAAKLTKSDISKIVNNFQNAGHNVAKNLFNGGYDFYTEVGSKPLSIKALPGNRKLLGYIEPKNKPQYGSKVNIPSSNEVIPLKDGVLEYNRTLLKRINKIFASRYGYDPIPLSAAATRKSTEDAIKKLMTEHATTARGVRDEYNHMSETNDKLKALGLAPTQENRLKYYATHYSPSTGHGRVGFDYRKYPEDKFGTIYTSNSIDVGKGYAANRGNQDAGGAVVIVRRPLDFSSPHLEDWVTNNEIKFTGLGRTKQGSDYFDYNLPYYLRNGVTLTQDYLNNNPINIDYKGIKDKATKDYFSTLVPSYSHIKERRNELEQLANSNYNGFDFKFPDAIMEQSHLGIAQGLLEKDLLGYVLQNRAFNTAYNKLVKDYFKQNPDYYDPLYTGRNAAIAVYKKGNKNNHLVENNIFRDEYDYNYDSPDFDAAKTEELIKFIEDNKRKYITDAVSGYYYGRRKHLDKLIKQSESNLQKYINNRIREAYRRELAKFNVADYAKSKGIVPTKPNFVLFGDNTNKNVTRNKYNNKGGSKTNPAQNYVYVGPIDDKGLDVVEYLPWNKLGAYQNLHGNHLGPHTKGLSRKVRQYGGLVSTRPSLKSGGVIRGFIPTVPMYDVQKLKNLYNYGVSYLKHKLVGRGDGEIIDLSKQNVSRIKTNTKDVNSILTNEFIEHNNNTIRKKKDFVNTTDTLIGDRKIPLSKISTFYGIENGKLKAGSLEIFNDETTVVPNRAKNIGKIKEYYPGRPESKEYKDAVEQGIVEYNNSKGYEANWLDKLLPLSGRSTPRGILFHNLLKEEGNTREGRIKARQRRMDIINNIRDKYIYLNEGALPFVVTENNDTIKGYNINATPKVLFADEKGNALFVSNIYKHSKKLNALLKKNPMYPIMVDNGRYAHYQTESPNVDSYSGLANADDMFIVGTTRPSLKSGGSIYIKPSHRGRLTELKARTGKSEAELYSDGNPAHKKMVVFARNARRWNK